MVVARKIFTVTRNELQPPQDHFTFLNRTRFIILLICTLCLSVAQSNTLTLNFTIICMTEDAPSINAYNVTGTIFSFDNGSYYEIDNSGYLERYFHSVESQRYAYTPNQKNLLFSFVAIGAMVAVYPVMWLIQKFGTRSIVTIFGFFSALCTSLIPLTAYLGFNWLLVIRFLQGSGLSTGFTLIGIVTRQWSMQKQNAFFIAFLTCFFQIGPIFTMPVAGALCTSSFGWSSVYYLHAIITCILFTLFLYFYRELPQKHSFVSMKELDRINRGKGDNNKKEPVPVKAILTSNAIYAIWISAIGNFMGIQVTMQFSPTYLNKVMGFPVEQTGLFSAIPQICTFILKMFAGVLADKATCCSPITSIKIFNSLSIGGMSLTFFALAFIPTSMPILGLVMLILCCTIVGFNCGAFFRSSAIVAAQHNHFIMGVNSFINCASSLMAPVVVNIFVQNDTWDEWWYVWMVHGVLLFACNIYFLVFGKGAPAEWTKSKNTSLNDATPPPRSHPRPGHFKINFNDQVSVSVQTTGLLRCDTCKIHPESPPALKMDAGRSDRTPILQEMVSPKVKRGIIEKRQIRSSLDNLEDYINGDFSMKPNGSHHELQNSVNHIIIPADDKIRF